MTMIKRTTLGIVLFALASALAPVQAATDASRLCESTIIRNISSSGSDCYCEGLWERGCPLPRPAL